MQSLSARKTKGSSILSKLKEEGLFNNLSDSKKKLDSSQSNSAAKSSGPEESKGNFTIHDSYFNSDLASSVALRSDNESILTTELGTKPVMTSPPNQTGLPAGQFTSSPTQVNPISSMTKRYVLGSKF